MQIDIKDEIMKIEDKMYLRKYDADGEFMRKMFKHIRDIIASDFGEEPEEFIELEARSEAWRAIRVLERLYTENE